MEITAWINFSQIQKSSDFIAILHDAAGSVKSTKHKTPGYFFDLLRFPSSCFIGHVTGLLFCLYIKILASTEYALFGF